jgi:hypothetical protein
MFSASLCLLLAQAAPATTTQAVVKTLYVDGAKIGQGIAADQLSFPYNRLTIGAEGNLYYRYNGLVGSIDEFAIYPTVLSDPCIAWHYSMSDTNAHYVSAVQHDNPKLWLRFEDANSENNAPAANSGSLGSAYNGTYIGDTVNSVTLVQGVWPGTQAASFSGANDGNGTCVDVNDAIGSLNCMEATIEFWVDANLNSTSPPQDPYPRFFQHNNGTALSYGAWYSVSTWEVDLEGGGGSAPIFNYTLLNGNWHHVVITYHEISSSATNYYNEVMADDPCLYLRFGDDPNGYADSSSNHYWVEYGPATSIVPVTTAGGIGSCIYLPGGGGSWVAAANRWTEPCLPTGPHSYSYAFAPNDITFEVWVRSNKTRDAVDPYAVMFNQTIISTADDSNAPFLGKNSNDEFEALTPFGGSDGSNMSYAVYTTSVGDPLAQFQFDDKWHQIVLEYHVHAGNNYHLEVAWYKDANLVKDKIYPNDPCYSGPTLGITGEEMDHIVIGGTNNRANVQNHWGGYYDEFAIYPTALSPARILAHYQAAQPQNCSQLWSRGQGMSADRNEDCFLNIDDFASFAKDWRKCNDPSGSCPGCTSSSCPPWW